MIATAEVVRDPALKGMAAPVPAVAAEMICSAASRWGHTYVPKWYWAWTQVTALGGSDFAEWVMRTVYIDKVPRYVAVLEGERKRLAEARVA